MKILDSEFKLDSGMKSGSYVIERKEILNAGKINHKIHGTFDVKQKNEKSKLSVKFFVVDDIQLVGWAEYRKMAHTPLFVDPSKVNYTGPQEYLYSSNEALPNGNFEIKEHEGNVLYFIIDNGFSKITSKNVQLTIWDEWDESVEPIDVVTTTPPEDTSIFETTQQMIISAKKELKIMSPYIDMNLIKPLLEIHEKGTKIKIIARYNEKIQKQKRNREALQFLQTKLGDDLRINELIHSRMIIKDELQALVSSADLTHDSLFLDYNAGIILSDPKLVQKLVTYYDQAFLDSKPLSHLQ